MKQKTEKLKYIYQPENKCNNLKSMKIAAVATNPTMKNSPYMWNNQFDAI